MNIEDVILEVQRVFGDESGVQVTSDDIIRWINQAQHEIVMHNESILETVTTEDLVADQDEYTFPADLLILRSLRLLMPDWDSYRYLKPYSLTDFDKRIQGWDGSLYGSGIPSMYTTYERTIFLFPPPDRASTDGLKILYSSKPTDITLPTGELTFPLEYHNAIIKYCLSKANTLDEDLEAAGYHHTHFIADVRQLGNRDGNSKETYPTITTLPEDL